MTALFDHVYRELIPRPKVVLWVCPVETCDTGALLGYWAEPRCSLCGEAMERSEDA